MPIEFRCEQCGKLLRTGDDTVGRQAQCPNCGTISVVPGPAEAGRSAAPLAPLDVGGSSAPGTPFASGVGVENPYGSPGIMGSCLLPGEPDPMAAARVAGPAIALSVVGILNIITGLGLAGVYGTIAAMVATGNGAGIIPLRSTPDQVMTGSIFWIILGVVGLLLGIVLLIGAMKMKRLESHTFAVIASIVAIIPCVSPCCLLGLPFGIWAIVVLSDHSVKAAFRS